MNGFVAIVLVCLAAVKPEDCTEKTVVDVISTPVRSELGCVTGWQEVIARSAIRSGIGSTEYVRTICRRIHASAEAAQ